jgi:hypothetical protein
MTSTPEGGLNEKRSFVKPLFILIRLYSMVVLLPSWSVMIEAVIGKNASLCSGLRALATAAALTKRLSLATALLFFFGTSSSW